MSANQLVVSPIDHHYMLFVSQLEEFFVFDVVVLENDARILSDYRVEIDFRMFNNSLDNSDSFMLASVISNN